MKKIATFFISIMLGLTSLIAQTIVFGTVTDIDGNVYKTTVIGKYVWMSENLKTTSYNNGTKIPKVSESNAWPGLDSAAYCWYNDNESNAVTYGALYNWFAVNTGILCPVTWRVPSDEEWKYLEGYADSLYGVGNLVWDKSGLRGYNAGKRLKATWGWRLGGSGTDDFGFSALPAGERLNSFNNTLNSSGFFWSSTGDGQSNAWYRCMIYSFDYVSRDIHPRRMGFSVRCIRDK
jgi:uncharacterized protein (TIGR02145 family)